MQITLSLVKETSNYYAFEHADSKADIIGKVYVKKSTVTQGGKAPKQITVNVTPQF